MDIFSPFEAKRDPGIFEDLIFPLSADNSMLPRHKTMRMWQSTARKANRIAVAPLELPSWTKTVLRLGPVSKMSVRELLEVMKV